MQDTVLRVLVLALGLLMCPRDDPGLEEEWEDTVTVHVQKYGELLLKEEVKLDLEMLPVSEKTALCDSNGPENTMEMGSMDKNQAERHVGDNRKVSNGVIVTQDSEDADSDPLTTTCFSTKPQKLLQREGREKEASISEEQEERETSEKALTVWEDGYIWYTWNILSFISMIRLLRRYLRKKADASTFLVTRIAAQVPLHDSNTLQSFHSKCVQAALGNKWMDEEFLDGFANHIVEAMRTICERNGDMVIEDHQIMSTRAIIVPLTPPKPMTFQFFMWNDQTSDPDLQMCGQIKVVENKKIPNGCHCQSSDVDEDMVCLLHSESKTKMSDVSDGSLCLKNTPFFSKSQVTRWFQGIIKQAWAQISHKYDFELAIRYIDAPGSLVIRFRSGKKFSFTINPVVKFNPECHFYITPHSPNDLDTYWTLSLTTYEDQLVQSVSKHLPENSCHIQTLQIACFLHRRQSALSGGSTFQEVHLKNALMHLLLTKQHCQWKPDCMAYRLRDLLVFVERSLEMKVLNHALIGNPLTQKFTLLPEVFTKAKPVNLFHPLVVHRYLHINAVTHFQEMLRNANVMLKDYLCGQEKSQPENF